MPEGLRRIFEEGELRMESNLLCLILSEKGKLVRAFQPWGGKTLHDMKFDPERMGAALLAEIEKATAKMKLPAPSKGESLRLPDTERGVRVFVKIDTRKDSLPQYRVPTVSAIAVTEEERKALAYSAESREIDAAVFGRWFEQACPPAVMDGAGGIRKVEGKLTLSPVGKTRAVVVRGDIGILLDNRAGTWIRGTLEGVVRYSGDSPDYSSLRFLFEGIFPKDRNRGNPAKLPIVVAIESRPE